MKHISIVLFALLLVACSPAQTPLPPTLLPASVDPTITSPPAEPVTEPLLTEVPAIGSPLSDATTFPDPDNYAWETVITGLERPIDIQHAGDERLFIVEKVGRIRILQNGQLIDFPYLNISDRVGSRGNEQGLLGLAFHPNYAENGLFFVNYTDRGGDTVIARFRVTPDPDLADPSSETVLVRAKQPFSNHNGGALAFGPDGYLYAGLGDGGSGGDPLGNAQKLDTFLGKILRLDVDSAEPYAIPADNPFGNELWAYGLRNPWRMSFDSATGDFYIGDVGQGEWEEIDFVSAGTPGGINFGWNILEGTHAYGGNQQDGLIPPIAEYRHEQGRCSVTGGYVYRGSMPEWSGIYFYGDYCTGEIWGLIRSGEGWQAQVLFDADGNITSFGQDGSGEVYVAMDNGQILWLAQR